jgi:hypothetical protein
VQIDDSVYHCDEQIAQKHHVQFQTAIGRASQKHQQDYAAHTSPNQTEHAENSQLPVDDAVQ